MLATCQTHQLSGIGLINDALSMFSVGHGNVGRTMPDGRTQAMQSPSYKCIQYQSSGQQKNQKPHTILYASDCAQLDTDAYFTYRISLPYPPQNQASYFQETLEPSGIRSKPTSLNTIKTKLPPRGGSEDLEISCLSSL